LLEACNAAVASGDDFHGISGVVGLGWELAAELVVIVATEAHLDQLHRIAGNGRHLKRQCSVGSGHLGRPCSHTALNPDRTATLVEAAGMRGCR
jgi:hypothetical protein